MLLNTVACQFCSVTVWFQDPNSWLVVLPDMWRCRPISAVSSVAAVRNLSGRPGRAGRVAADGLSRISDRSELSA
jgi:hypothetical protein